jgi:hypothetical protein
MSTHSKPILRTLLGLATFLIAAGPTFAQDAPATDARYCEVTIDFSVNGHPVAAPNTIVEFGKEAEVTIRDANGVHGWQIAFVVDAPTLARRAMVMPSRFALSEMAKDQAFLRAEPHLNLVPGQRATLDMAFDDGRKASFAVLAEIRSAAEVDARLEAAGEAN